MKQTRLLGLVICLLFITNLEAQKMHEYWNCEYEYNDADMTAGVKLWNGYIGGNGYPGMSELGFEEGSEILVIPNHAVNPKNGLTYTVTKLQKGTKGIGWADIYNGKPFFNEPIKVYIPKTIKSIGSQVFEITYQKNIHGRFYFYFEDERTLQYAIEYGKKMSWDKKSETEKESLRKQLTEKQLKKIYIPNFEGIEDIAKEFADDWFVENLDWQHRYSLSGSWIWNVVRFNSEDTNISINDDKTRGEISIYLNDNVITSISVIPSWAKVTIKNSLRSTSENVNIDEDFILEYTLEANTGTTRSGNIVLTDNKGVSKIITINQVGLLNTGVSNVNVSNVNYRIDKGVVYFDEVVNNIQLYDLSGRLLYSNKNTGTLNIGNNLKGVYVLKYDNKTSRIIF